jgi:hypothetical protein
MHGETRRQRPVNLPSRKGAAGATQGGTPQQTLLQQQQRQQQRRCGGAAGARAHRGSGLKFLRSLRSLGTSFSSTPKMKRFFLPLSSAISMFAPSIVPMIRQPAGREHALEGVL